MAALETTENKIIHQGDSSSVAFDVPFLFYADTDLNVYLNDTTSEDDPVLVDVSAYTVAGAGDDDGGTATMDTAPLSTEELIIEREVDEDQESEYTNYNRFPGPTVTKNFNRVVMMVQQLQEQLSRSLLKPINETTPTTIPSPSTGKALKWDEFGNLVNSTYDPDDQQQSIADAQAAQAAAELAQTGAETAETNAGISATQAEVAASFVNSADVEWKCNSSTQVVISTGSKIRGVDSGVWATFDTSRTFDITGTPGDLGALNTGTEAADTHYYLIALIDTNGVLDPHIIGVTEALYASFTTGDLTGNYAVYNDYARMGSIRNNASSNFIQGEYVDGEFFLSDPNTYREETTGQAWPDIDFSGVFPLTARKCDINFFATSAGTIEADWRYNGASGGGTKCIKISSGGAQSNQCRVKLDSAQLFEANISGTDTLFMQPVSYLDDLQRKGQ